MIMIKKLKTKSLLTLLFLSALVAAMTFFVFDTKTISKTKYSLPLSYMVKRQTATNPNYHDDENTSRFEATPNVEKPFFDFLNDENRRLSLKLNKESFKNFQAKFQGVRKIMLNLDKTVGVDEKVNKSPSGIERGQQPRMEQLENYMLYIHLFLQSHEIKQVCEVGLGTGHTAALFLHATASSKASYLVFDSYKKQWYHGTSFNFIIKRFPGRNIQTVEGYSMSKVKLIKMKKSCDLIHINCYLRTFRRDLFKIASLASADNLLLINDCPRITSPVDEALYQGLRENSFSFTPIKHNTGITSWYVTSFQKKQVKSLTFLGKEFCVPPYRGRNCNEISANVVCIDKERDSCYYNDVYGVASLGCYRWSEAQSARKKTWFAKDTNNAHNGVHDKAFDYYNALPNDLGHVIEIGSGAFTQSQNIHNKGGKQMASMTLLEPLAFQYMAQVKKCFYKQGSFANLPTTILGIPAEDLASNVQYDTVIMINVLEHVFDAFSTLRAVLNLVKPGGIFIWHERIWNNYKGKAIKYGDQNFHLHPIRLKNIVVELVKEQFKTLYFANNISDSGNGEMYNGVYFIGQRYSQELPPFKLPEHEKCIDVEAPYGINVIFIVSKASASQCKDYMLKAAKGYDTPVKSLAVVLEHALHKNIINHLVKGLPKLKLLISHLHFNTWKREASKFLDLKKACIFNIDNGNLTILSNNIYNRL